jgi:anti-anti-sigma factor
MTLNPRRVRELFNTKPMIDAPRDFFRLHPTPPGVPAATVIELLLPEVLDSLEIDRLNDTLLTAIAADPSANWVLDLAGTAYMGSAVLGLLVNLRHRIKSANGQLSLCSLSPALLGVFQATSLQRLFAIHPTRPDALRALAGR